MLKKLYLLLTLSFCVLLTACTKDASEPLILTPEAPSAQLEGIDVDLTTLSATMVYAEVFNMVTQPTDYIGKKVKAQGELASYENPQTGQIYYAVLISDATACCSQGLEFILTDDAEYPAMGEPITVVGEFETYDEDGLTYCRLKDATLVV